MPILVDGAEVTLEELQRARRYPMVIEWSDEDTLFLASFPDVPGLRTHGTTAEDAARHGEEVIVLWVTAMIDAGRPVPPPTHTARAIHVAPPDTYNAERVRRIRRRLDVSQRVFADLLNVSLGTVRSWEQGWRVPDGASSRLLSIAEHQPAFLTELTAPSGNHEAPTGENHAEASPEASSASLAHPQGAQPG